jgi:uncharacterized protein YndB with AHSA1/START domain
MTERPIAHGSFTLERRYPASPAKVFAAFADPQLKGKWYGNPDGDSAAEIFEFRVGGREYRRGEISSGQTFAIDIRYHDIIEGERIVYAYEVMIDGARTSVSIAAVELRPDGAGTRLSLTEHGAFLDGLDLPEERPDGAAFTLDRLTTVLAANS